MNFKRIALLSIALNAAIVLSWAGRRIIKPNASKADAQKAFYDQWNLARRSVLDGLPIDTSDYVFVGNSITEGFPLTELFHSMHFKNRGISGNRSIHIRGRIGEIASAHPRKIFLDVGINDILNDVPLDSSELNVMAIIDTIGNLSPQTEVIMQTVLPLGPSQKAKEPQVRAFNNWLTEYCRQWNIPCIDLFPAFLKDGALDRSLTMDDIHINGRGYAIWKAHLEPYL